MPFQKHGLFSKQNGKAAFVHIFSYCLMITDQVQLDLNIVYSALNVINVLQLWP